MRKSNVETRYDRRHGHLPCINVKVYNYGIYAPEVAEHFGCSEKTAERALEYCFQSAQEQFWEQIGNTVAEIFPGTEAYSDGRCGGWLVVEGLPDVESWDAVMCSKWGKLCRIVESEIHYLTGREYTLDAIESNRWHLDGAERFNFIDRAGEVVCIAEMKQQAIAAGFAPVIRG